jgi:glycerol-3-phosphate dehydrogenase (NAD(P)+)
MVTAAEARVRVGVVGLGAWGTALALHCARQGHDVVAWKRDPADSQGLRVERSLCVAATPFTTPSNMRITSDLSECGGADFVIVALPASAWHDVVPGLQAKILISATKGLERISGLTPLQYAHERLGRSAESLCVISGPSFASDVASGTPVSLTAGSTSDSTAQRVAQILSGKTLRVYTSDDPLGVELGGILKNIVAIAVGISDGLSYGPSTRAALITRGLAEITRIASALGAKQQTLYGLSGLGDLVMTSTDDQSRNRTVGLRLGRGESLTDIVASLGATAEGVTSAPLVERLAKDHQIEAPIVSGVVQVVQGALSPKDLAIALMSRPLKSEF